MDSEPQNNFDVEIETLKTMFGELVSTAVIVAVLESCNGDVNLAAEGIMNMVCDGPSDSNEMQDNAIGVSQPGGDSERGCVCTSEDTEQVESTVETIQDTDFIPLKKSGNPVDNESVTQNASTISTYNSTSISYAEAFRSTGAVPKIRDNTYNDNNDSRYQNNTTDCWNNQLRKILTYHNQGFRIMIIMRGVPGSGKSTLAQHVIDLTVGAFYQNYDTHIFSSDDYFLVRGKYLYDRNYLQEAHQVNQRKVFNATNQGLSPVIIDNTNVKAWEMEPYMRDAVRNGYYIEIIEPNTPWVRNANELSRKNIHNVPKEKIRKMLDEYEKNVTVANLMKTFRLRYPINKTPPIKRNIPPPPEVSITPVSYNNNHGLPHSSDLVHEPEHQQLSKDISIASTSNAPNLTYDSNEYPNKRELDYVANPNDLKPTQAPEDEITNSDTATVDSQESKRLAVILEAQKKQEEMEVIEKEWENGESWATETTQVEINNTSDVPKPPRKEQNEDSNIIQSSDICDDWSKIAMYMPPWQDKNASATTKQETLHTLETATKSTCMEIGDINNAVGLLKVVDCSARNINNENSHEDKKEKIPDQRMLDKSTSTHERALAGNHKCKNEEHHFNAFRKMFKSVSRPVLRDVFDKCLGDVNWAVNIVLDGMGDNEMLTARPEELSDADEEPVENCDCLAAYNIIPDTTTSTQELPVPVIMEQTNSPSHALQKKLKRERKTSENEKILELKRQIENNVIISDHHYSQHYLSLRRGRRDNLVHEQFKPNPTNSEQNMAPVSNEINSTQAQAQAVITNDEIISQHSIEEIEENTVPNTTSGAKCNLDYDYNSPNGEIENVSINIGTEFVKKLDELFGRQGIVYPDSVKPVVNMPMSLLKEINALWAESIAFQMDSASVQTKEMIQEDEEFARELISKERELAQDGKESQVPDFKEIMDMDLALSIYERDVAVWRNNEPQDLAARMSRNKLYNLFPDVAAGLLDELMMAHDNNFHATVESLLISTGQGHILKETNGVNKFIMQKEVEKKEKLLEEERKALSEEDWPFLARPDTVVTMDEVNHYRDEAQRFLNARNANRIKAQYYAGRNQFSVAAFYNDIASHNVRRFEQANSRAAISLIQYHAMTRTEFDLLDLHYLRVPEARETLDLFIDNQIQKLRDYKKISNRDPDTMTLYFITGRGMHSHGEPRIKPAIRKRLTDRDLIPSERNPGLLSTKISMYTKQTHELNRDA